jgi:hypothetical protein
MGIETSADHGGAEMSFMAAILAVEGWFGPHPPTVSSLFPLPSSEMFQA